MADDDDRIPMPWELRDRWIRVYRYHVSRTAPYPWYRWSTAILIAAIYIRKVYKVNGFFIVSYGLGIYILNLLIGFLSPKHDLETDSPILPRGTNEYRPFVRMLPEFRFWYSFTKAFCISLCLSCMNMFDVPVFWPVLLLYWGVLFILSMRRQVLHMMKYKYVPFSRGKRRSSGGAAAARAAPPSPVPNSETPMPSSETPTE